MMERFVTTIPFFSSFVTQNGGVLGDRTNCNELLKRGESVLVFPEGVRGISKNTNNFYHIQKFTKGFYRLAQKNGVDILPVGVVGAEEFYPLTYHPKILAKLIAFLRCHLLQVYCALWHASPSFSYRRSYW